MQTINQSPLSTYQRATRLTAEAQDAVRNLRLSLRMMLLQLLYKKHVHLFLEKLKFQHKDLMLN